MPALPTLTGKVIFPNSANYEDARTNFNRRFDYSPRAIVFCQTVGDVINAVKWASASRVPIRVRGGRHSYEAFSLANQSLVVDLTDMEACSIDPARQQMTVQAGIEQIKAYENLWSQGFTLPMGSCATVGLTGVTLGGGYGLLARKLGLACDRLISAEVVSAKGQLFRAAADANADLFWALRGGGGGNFGIVTSLSYSIHPVQSVTLYQIVWNWAETANVIRAWQEWAPDTDERLTCTLKLRPKSVGTVSSVGLFMGTEAELQPLLKPLLEIAPQTSSLQTVSMMEAVRILAGLQPNYPGWMKHWNGSQTKFKNTSDFVNVRWSEPAIAALTNTLQTTPSKNIVIQCDSYGGAINRVATEATAFPHRQQRFNIQYQAYWKLDAEQAAHLQWIKETKAAMQPFVSGSAYVNYCDRDLKNWQVAYYGRNWQRLVTIKRKYDPENLFSFEQSVALA
jgi:FAD/FMN-containing dehydrogenase